MIKRRIAFLKEFMANAPLFEELEPFGDDKGRYMLARPGEYYLACFTDSQNAIIELAGDAPYKVDAIDTWEMQEVPIGTAQPGLYNISTPRDDYVYRFISYKPYV